MKILRSKSGFAPVLVLAVVAVIAGVGFFVFALTHQTSSSGKKSVTGVGQTAPGKVVTNVEFSTSLNSDGSAANPAHAFTTTQPKIFAVMTLNNPSSGTKLQFIRYRDTKFVDQGSITLPKSGARVASFAFVLKAGETQQTGTYRVKVYVNGNYTGSAKYEIK